MNSPDQTTITVAPSGVKLARGICLTYEHPSANTFCVLGVAGRQVIITSGLRPHKFLYNALKLCSEEPDRERWAGLLADYDAAVLRGCLNKLHLRDFRDRYIKDHGFPRYSAISGRAWPNLSTGEMGTFAAVAFWNRRAFANEQVVALVRRAFKLKAPLHLCYASEKTCEWRV